MLQALLEEDSSSSEICSALGIPIIKLQKELIHLYHLMVIKIVGLSRVPLPKYRNYIWQITTHGREHFHPVSGCTACEIRSRRILREGGFI